MFPKLWPRLTGARAFSTHGTICKMMLEQAPKSSQLPDGLVIRSGDDGPSDTGSPALSAGARNFSSSATKRRTVRLC